MARKNDGVSAKANTSTVVTSSRTSGYLSANVAANFPIAVFAKRAGGR